MQGEQILGGGRVKEMGLIASRGGFRPSFFTSKRKSQGSKTLDRRFDPLKKKKRRKGGSYDPHDRGCELYRPKKSRKGKSNTREGKLGPRRIRKSGSHPMGEKGAKWEEY